MDHINQCGVVSSDYRVRYISMKVYEFLGPLGLAGYTALGAAFLSGFLKFKFHVKWLDMKWHFWAGILAIVFASLHLAVFIYTNF